MINAIELPFCQPGRATISRTSAERSGVRWSGPRSFKVCQEAGDHATAAVVKGRAEMLFAVGAKMAGLSAACARRMRAVGSFWVSSAENWMLAAAMTAPG